jgi:hypothetical protein
MKTILMFLTAIIISNVIIAQRLSDYVNIENVDNRILVSKHSHVREPIYYDYFRDGLFITRVLVTTTPSELNFIHENGSHDYNFELIQYPGTTNEVALRIGLATVDDIDIRMLNDDELYMHYSVLCNEKKDAIAFEIVNGYLVDITCFCNFIDNINTVSAFNALNLPNPMSVYPGSTNKWQSYRDEENDPSDPIKLYNHIIMFCKEGLPIEDDTHKGDRLMNPNTLDLDAHQSIKVYGISGIQFEDITDVSNLQMLSAGIYIVKYFDNGNLKTIKYIVE